MGFVPPAWRKENAVLLRLLILFTVVPFVELVILAWIADRTNWVFTISLVLVTGIIGAALARHEGLRCLRQIQDRLRRGEVPAGSLLDGLMILIAGALLVTPGILTDVAGFLLLLPAFRRLIKQYATQQIRSRLRVVSPFDGRTGQEQPEGDRIIDVRIVDVEAQEPADDGDRRSTGSTSP